MLQVSWILGTLPLSIIYFLSHECLIVQDEHSFLYTWPIDLWSDLLLFDQNWSVDLYSAQCCSGLWSSKIMVFTGTFAWMCLPLHVKFKSYAQCHCPDFDSGFLLTRNVRFEKQLTGFPQVLESWKSPEIWNEKFQAWKSPWILKFWSKVLEKSWNLKIKV